MKRRSKEKFGVYIQKVRETKGMSRAELADKLFVTEAAVWKWEKGKRYPDFETLGNLAEELGISTQDIYDNSLEEKEGVNVAVVAGAVLMLVPIVIAIVFGLSHIKRGDKPTDIIDATNEQTTEEDNTIEVTTSVDKEYAIEKADWNVMQKLSSQSEPISSIFIKTKDDTNTSFSEISYVYDDNGYLVEQKQKFEGHEYSSILITYDDDYRFKAIKVYSTVDESADMKLVGENIYEYDGDKVTITEKDTMSKPTTYTCTLLTDRERMNDLYDTSQNYEIISREYDEGGRITSIKTLDTSNVEPMYFSFDYEYEADDHYKCCEYMLFEDGERWLIAVTEFFEENGNVVKEIRYENEATSQEELLEKNDISDFKKSLTMIYDYNDNNKVAEIKTYKGDEEDYIYYDTFVGTETNLQQDIMCRNSGSFGLITRVIDSAGIEYYLGNMEVLPDYMHIDEHGKLKLVVQGESQDTSRTLDITYKE